MAINVGDAVLTFLGDSTQLELAFDKVNVEAEAKLQPTVRTLAEINDQLVATGGTALTAYQAQVKFGDEVALTAEELVNAQREAKGFGTEAQYAAEKAAFSMREAKGEIALLGEEIGIKVPRHLRGFVAELPGVGAALNAAFSATAVLILLQLLVEGAEKLSEFVSHTFIFTAAQEESNKAIGDANKKLEELSKQYDDAADKVEKFGKNAVQLTAENVADLTKKQEEGKQKLIELTKEFGSYKDKVEETAKASGLFNVIENEQNTIFGKLLVAIPVVGAAYTAYQVKKAKGAADAAEKAKEEQEQEIVNQAAALRTQGKQLEEARQLQAKANEDAYVKREEGTIASEEKIEKTRIKFVQAGSEFEALAYKDNGAIIAAIRQKAAEDEYQITLTTLERKLKLYERDPDKNVAAILKINADIDEERKKEYARNFIDVDVLSKEIANTFEKNVNGPLLQFTNVTLANVINQSVEAAKASQALGFTFSGDVSKGLEDARKAYNTLRDSGVASNRDLLAGSIALAKAQLELSRVQGTVAAGEEKNIDDLQKKYDKLYGSITNVSRAHLKLSQIWKEAAPDAGQLKQELSDLASQGFDKMATAATSSFAAIIDGSEASGPALAKALSATLASLAAESAIRAIVMLAKGFEYASNPVTAAQAPVAFAAATQYAEAAAAAGAGAVALSFAGGNRSGGGSGSSGAAPNTVAGNQNQALSDTTQGSGTPVVRAFASGGLVSGPTLAVLGEEAGAAHEAVLPLDNPNAIAGIVKALGGGGDSKPVIHQWNVKGLVSPDTLSKVMKNMSRAGDSGRARLTSTNSTRLTRKS